MSKRSHADSADILPAAKRVRSTAVDRLSSLSDELILRTFSYLTISELVLCYRLVSASPSPGRLADIKDYRTGLVLLQRIRNYGNPRTMIASYALERSGSLACAIMTYSRGPSIFLRRSRDGSKMTTLSREADGQIGSGSTN